MKILVEVGDVEYSRLSKQLTFKVVCNVDAVLATEDSMGNPNELTMEQVAKEMGKMMADFDHFGTLGPKVMASVAVQVRRLGIEMKEMAAVVDKFDNFD